MPLEGNLEVTVEGQRVTFAFTVENGGTRPVELEFRSGKVADVVVSEDEQVVWRWSEGQMFTQALDTETLQPGEKFTREMTWEDPPPGQYTAEATLDAPNLTLVERESFSVS